MTLSFIGPGALSRLSPRRVIPSAMKAAGKGYKQCRYQSKRLISFLKEKGDPSVY